MLWLRLFVNDHVIPILILIHFLLLTKFLTKPLQAPHCCYIYLFYINLDTTYFCTKLDTTSYILAINLFEKRVLYILRSQG